MACAASGDGVSRPSHRRRIKREHVVGDQRLAADGLSHYRPLQVNLGGLACVAGTITALPFDDGTVSSLSCLHVIEHIGLGRYGDPMDADGSLRACAELQRVLAPDGRLYLSVPVGRERVCFNAHRVFSPQSIVDSLPSLQLLGFSLIRDDAVFVVDASFAMAREQEYGCGLFEFTLKNA